MSHAVVLNNTSIHSLVVGDDCEDRVMLHFWAMDRFVAFHVPLALFLDDLLGKRKFCFSIEHPSFVVRLLSRIIALEGRNFVAKELRLFRARMRDERFGLGEFQLEVFTQELAYLAFDFLSLFLRPDIA